MKERETYTSPHTGRVYAVETETYTRMGGDWYAGEALREQTVTKYNFYFEGEKVTWTYNFEETYLEGVFAEIEGVYASWTTSARD